ncbi:MAG: NADH-quinone oxidoreductase subunit L [bacterium]
MEPSVDTALRWIVLLPLLGAAINGLLNRRLPRRLVGLIACSSVGVSFALTVRVFLRLKDLPVAERFITDSLYTWLGFGAVSVDLGFAMDQLSAIMALVVTGVSFLIHIYSLGYMAHDQGYQRFFAYLNLFVFAMLCLVLGENLLMLFVGWEGVGLCSYLLISFWFNDEANAAAGKKAFIVNRVGDFGFLLGIFLVGATLMPHLGEGEGLFSFRVLAAHSHLLAPVATALGLLFFLGATGKSAQIPLYIWLPDAMAGPTPVSALIHAATMVTAGVYMVARLNFIYVQSETAMLVVAIVGAATALLAATIALAQNDIKKVLAYSTVSQLGYMMLACGVGAFTAGIFHLMTHAFFKALLFLGSGSVIHAMSNEQDMRVMGGLAKRLPLTFWTFLTGTLAITGIFPLAGFFSKDEILWKVFSGEHGSPVLWGVGFLVAGLTAFYMMRLVVLTFAGKNRASEEVRHHIHESPATMTAPLVVLAVLSVIGGWIGWPHFLGGSNRFEQWLEPVFLGPGNLAHVELVLQPGHHAADGAHLVESGHSATEAAAHQTHETVAAAAEHAAHNPSTEWLLMLLSVGIAILGLSLGYWIYHKRADLAEGWRRLAGGGPHRLLANKYYVDELYENSLIKPAYLLSRKVLWRWIDAGLIDGLLVNGSAIFVAITGSILRLFQNGMLRFYAYVFALGVAAFFLFLSLSS